MHNNILILIHSKQPKEQKQKHSYDRDYYMARGQKTFTEYFQYHFHVFSFSKARVFCQFLKAIYFFYSP